MYRFGMRSAAAFLALIILMTASSPAVFGSPSVVQGSISVDSPVEIVPNKANETTVSIPGSFRVDSKNGPDTLLVTDAGLSISGGTWSAALSETHWEGIEEGRIYTFTITVIIPAGSAAGESVTYTLTLVFSNILGSSTPETTPLNIVLMRIPNGDNDPDDGPDDNDTADQPDVGNPFPIWIIFVGGLVVLLAGGAVWAFRNLEMVREDDGGRRIMMKERKVYRKKDIEELSLEEDQL